MLDITFVLNENCEDFVTYVLFYSRMGIFQRFWAGLVIEKNYMITKNNTREFSSKKKKKNYNNNRKKIL